MNAPRLNPNPRTVCVDERELERLKTDNARLREALHDVRQELWNDGDGGPRYAGYLAIVDAALEPST